jgi:predicted Zn-dependent peptidase
MLDRSAAPPFVKATNFILPGIQPIRLKNGCSLFINGGVQQDILKIEMFFPAGKWHEPRHGISHFTSNMLERGTKTMVAAELAEAFDGLGAHIEIVAGFDLTTISLYALKRNWQQAFAIIMDMLLEPTFPEGELALMKSIFLQNLKVNLEKNSFVAGQLIRKNIFGNHPYGTSLTEKDVTPIGTKLLKQFYSGRYSPFVVFVTAPSSIRPGDFERALEPFGAPLNNFPNAGDSQIARHEEHVDKPDSIQTSIRMGKRSLRLSHKDYAGLSLLNHVLGGYFGSRLMKNIREEKGLTYGIYSSINSLQHDSFFVVGADVNKSDRDLAVDEIRKEIRHLREEEISRNELEIARSHYLGALQLELANPFSLTDKYRDIYTNQLPEDYFTTLFNEVSSLDSQTLMRLANEYIKEDSLCTVTVG